jgi:pimeloyl-ACP methyl ester carboxylesterase
MSMTKLTEFGHRLILVSCICAPCAMAQRPVEGHWEGTMTRDAKALAISIDVSRVRNRLSARFTSAAQKVMEYPFDTISYNAPKLHLDLAGGSTLFDGELRGDSVVGEFKDEDGSGKFSLHRSVALPLPYGQANVTFRNDSVSLSGTLFTPAGPEPHPAIVILQGSGPESRWGTARFLADRFARHGVAALIYDKRGVGGSSGDWTRSDFHDLARDALAGIHLLQRTRGINQKEIGVYGHSQGGSIAPLIASTSSDVAFVISGAGSGVPMYEAEINSLTNQARARGVSGSDLEDAVTYIKMFVDVARTGTGVTALDSATARVRTKPWFRFVAPPPKSNYWWAFFQHVGDYDPAKAWERVHVPVLIIQAEHDYTVPVQQSIVNIDRALTKAGNADYTILMLPRASHTFNINPEPGQPFEWWHVAPGFPDLLPAWVNLRMGGRGSR